MGVLLVVLVPLPQAARVRAASAIKEVKRKAYFIQKVVFVGYIDGKHPSASLLIAMSRLQSIAVATSVRTKTFLWVRSAHPQKCPKHNGYGYISLML